MACADASQSFSGRGDELSFALFIYCPISFTVALGVKAEGPQGTIPIHLYGQRAPFPSSTNVEGLL